MTSIQAINSAPTFTSAYKRNTENYYTGVKTGAVYAATGSACAIGLIQSLKPLMKLAVKTAKKNVAEGITTKEEAYKSLQSMFKLKKTMKNFKFGKKLAIASGVMVGIGALVDVMNNVQRKFNAPNAKTSKGNEYTKVDMGKKTGAFFGAAYAIGNLILHAKGVKSACGLKLSKKISHVCIAAIGGYVLGAITDKLANNKAAKAANKA